VEVHVSLLGRSDLAGEIYRQVRATIIAGRLHAGDALPPTRELARRLSVSRGTVAVAYERLSGEGYVTSRVGAGTFVSGRVARGKPAGNAADGALRPRPIWEHVPVSAAFAAPARYEFPGERVAVEDPGYAPSRRLFESLGLDVTGVPVDEHGLVVDALPASARLVYVTPSH
jgi:GntR family transcriptional regulator/MocR family aminotransferase